MMTATTATPHTIRTGWYRIQACWLTFRKKTENGKAPSREKAQLCREAAKTLDDHQFIYIDKSTKTYNAKSHEELHDHHNNHKPQRAILAQRIIVYLPWVSQFNN